MRADYLHEDSHLYSHVKKFLLHGILSEVTNDHFLLVKRKSGEILLSNQFSNNDLLSIGDICGFDIA